MPPAPPKFTPLVLPALRTCPAVRMPRSAESAARRSTTISLARMIPNAAVSEPAVAATDTVAEVRRETGSVVIVDVRSSAGVGRNRDGFVAADQLKYGHRRRSYGRIGAST